MHANAWAGYSVPPDETAGAILARLSVIAEISRVRSRKRTGSTGRTAIVGWLGETPALMCIALTVVFFAASGFVLTTLNDGSAARAERTTPSIEMARRALEDAKAARDRECVKVGPICRVREDAIAARQRTLDEALAEVRATADPQAEALHVTPNALRATKAGAMVALSSAAGYIIALSWGLLFQISHRPSLISRSAT